ncbi:MAG: hypothetical protein ACR2OU_00705 [Thermomicrobiales bacterium]
MPSLESLPEIAYSADHTVYRVTGLGRMTINHRQIFLSKALPGVRPTSFNGVLVLGFCHQATKRLDLRTGV